MWARNNAFGEWYNQSEFKRGYWESSVLKVLECECEGAWASDRMKVLVLSEGGWPALPQVYEGTCESIGSRVTENVYGLELRDMSLCQKPII